MQSTYKTANSFEDSVIELGALNIAQGSSASVF